MSIGNSAVTGRPLSRRCHRRGYADGSPTAGSVVLARPSLAKSGSSDTRMTIVSSGASTAMLVPARKRDHVPGPSVSASPPSAVKQARPPTTAGKCCWSWSWRHPHGPAGWPARAARWSGMMPLAISTSLASRPASERHRGRDANGVGPLLSVIGSIPPPGYVLEEHRLGELHERNIEKSIPKLV